MFGFALLSNLLVKKHLAISVYVFYNKNALLLVLGTETVTVNRKAGYQKRHN